LKVTWVHSLRESTREGPLLQIATRTALTGCGSFLFTPLQKQVFDGSFQKITPQICAGFAA
jgi:hypothetical protein